MEETFSKKKNKNASFRDGLLAMVAPMTSGDDDKLVARLTGFQIPFPSTRLDFVIVRAFSGSVIRTYNT